MRYQVKCADILGRAIVVAFVSSLATLISITGAAAQSDQDFADKDQPAHYDAHASCDSKTLPKTHKIVGKVPGRENECYWVRSGEIIDIIKDPTRPPLPDYLQTGGDTSPSDALSLAHSRYGAALGYIETKRKTALAAFSASFAGCGADIGCLFKAVRTLQQKQGQFAAEERSAAGDLGRDIAKIQAHFNLDEDWAKNAGKRP